MSISVSANVLTLFTGRSGDCPGGDMADGAELSVEQCAFKCIITPLCVAFSYVSDIGLACWIKGKSCTNIITARNTITYDRS